MFSNFFELELLRIMPFFIYYSNIIKFLNFPHIISKKLASQYFSQKNQNESIMLTSRFFGFSQTGSAFLDFGHF